MESHKKHPWYRRRGYPHFDHPVSFKDAHRLVSSPSSVSTHSFYPFIKFDVITYKVKRSASNGKLERVQKLRPIAYASHCDCHIYSFYAFQLSKIYEGELAARNLQSHVLAFRPLGKSNVDFAFDAFESIRKYGNCSVIALDVKGFFDNLDHLLVKKSWSSLIGQTYLPSDHYALFKSLTSYSTVNLDQLYALLGISKNNRLSTPARLCSAESFRTNVRGSGLVVRHTDTKGIPQGSPISAFLSNVYMLEYDSAMRAYIETVGGHYFRYCDDILIIVPPERKSNAEKIAVSEIAKLKLEINSAKTDRVDFVLVGSELVASKPLQYLGFLYDGRNIFLRSASLARYAQRMRAGVRLAKSTMRKRNTVRVAKGEAAKPLFRKKLNQQYSHFGRRNFLSYGYKAARKMGSLQIRKQLRPLWKRLQNEIEE